nr:MAG TPA: hypothetical protein [Caudoviricetes sp.]
MTRTSCPNSSFCPNELVITNHRVLSLPFYYNIKDRTCQALS